MKIKFLLALSLIITFISSHSFAAHNSDRQKQSSSSWYITPPSQWPLVLRPGYFSQKNASSLDIFYPFIGTDQILTFFNPRFLWDDQNVFEQNYGLGTRILMDREKVILGGNVYYDLQRSRYKHTYHQIGLGIEALSKWIDCRSNGYFPISHKKKIGEDILYYFGSRSLIKTASDRYEKPLIGFDYELGALIPYIEKYLETRAYLLGYHYFNSSKNIHGIRGRIQVRPFSFLTLNGGWYQDNHRSARGYIEAYLTIPLASSNEKKSRWDCLGKKWRWKAPSRSMRKRMIDRVERDRYIFTGKTTSSPQETTAIEGITFVDNSHTGLELGTLENPYTTVQGGIDNVIGDKWVYVFKGNTNYMENITMSADVTLWGEGYDNGFSSIASTGYPIIDANNVSEVVAMANGTRIMGLTLQHGIGIILAENTSNVTIDHNRILDTVDQELLGGITILNNTANTISTIEISNNFCQNSSDIVVRNLDGGIISNISIDQNMCNQCAIGILTENTAGGSIDTLSISNNEVTASNQTGILINNKLGGTITDVTLYKNTCKNNTYGIGIENDATGSMQQVIITKNLCKNNSTGIGFSNTGTGSLSAKVYFNTATINFIGVNYANSGGGSLNVDTGGGSLGSVGNNAFYLNNSLNMRAALPATVQATLNYWGEYPPNSSLISGSIEYLPALLYKPFDSP